jgi:hypothetical protein
MEAEAAADDARKVDYYAIVTGCGVVRKLEVTQAE